eukprot:Skav202736  [mRNA]  locus=scaffold1326:230131:232110:- [translate_table: standard]
MGSIWSAEEDGASGTGSSQAIASNGSSVPLGITGPSTSIDRDQSSAAPDLLRSMQTLRELVEEASTPRN